MNNKLNLNIEYKIPEKSRGKDQTNQALTQDYNYINFCIASVYKNGLAGQLRRIDGRLKNKIQDAISSKNDIIELEPEEIKHIKKCISEAEVPTGLTQYLKEYLGAIAYIKSLTEEKK